MRIRKDKKKGGGASCSRGAVLTIAWRDRGRLRKCAIGIAGTSIYPGFLPEEMHRTGVTSYVSFGAALYEATYSNLR
jgi:hypothetical protein